MGRPKLRSQAASSAPARSTSRSGSARTSASSVRIRPLRSGYSRTRALAVSARTPSHSSTSRTKRCVIESHASRNPCRTLVEGRRCCPRSTTCCPRVIGTRREVAACGKLSGPSWATLPQHQCSRRSRPSWRPSDCTSRVWT